MTDLATIKAAADRACARIAPTWPLDRFIAVNPFWPRTDKPLPVVAGELAGLSGARLLMSRQWYATEWREGRLSSEHLREALAESRSDATEDDLIASFWIQEPRSSRRPLVVDVLETLQRRESELSWREFVIERVSRFCASFFDDGQGSVSGVRIGGLFSSWRNQVEGDRPNLFMELDGYRKVIEKMPINADDMLATGCSDLGVPAGELERYFEALLLDVNGWSSWCAYLGWTARLAGEADEHLRELLAVRLAWEWILLRSSDDSIGSEWRFAMTSWAAIDRAAQLARSDDWILQRAVEIAWLSRVRQPLADGLAIPRPATPWLQAAFCIDVRSEVFRRALEVDEGVQTFGAAGFFGLPVEYRQLAADDGRPQLPGLMAPKYRITDTGVPPGLETTRHARLDALYSWKAFKASSLSSFAFVDAMGLFYARNIFHDAFREAPEKSASHDSYGLKPAEDRTRVPRLTSRVDSQPLSNDERAQLAENLLRAIGLTRGFARFVLLVGHGAETKNNAHAAGLDCGACCGQPGDANARSAAALFNDPDVREALAARGIEIPAETRFVGALHNTTTDEVALFDVDADLPEVRTAFERAGVATRRARAPQLGLGDLDDKKLHAAMIKRARNWAEVRPEWGLTGNAAMIIAPRERSRHIDLEGRVFLHDYRCDEDPTAAVLEAIMTGPMVVSHWINFQYYASTVDNARYGCGDKVLHNIVGGHLGVFEGNAGDLRIGLAMQSLHDGERWVHAPLRLAVFIEAPKEAIDAVVAKHAKVRELVDNEWLHLFQLDGDERAMFVRRHGNWQRTT